CSHHTHTCPSILACGNRPLAQNGDSRVVGGKDALPGNWPWMVSIQEPYEDGYSHLCGGIILNKVWVLTAAHCFKNRGRNYLLILAVRLDVNLLSRLGSVAQIRTIKEKVEHAKYIKENEANDIALIMMNKAISFNNYTQPACLPAKPADVTKMTECFIAGWVHTRPSETTDILQEAKVELISNKRCNSLNFYNGAIGVFNLCAGYEQGGIDSCQGDSGGPLMCRRLGAPLFSVVGVTSWGSGCAQKESPGVYTNTQYFLDWILGKIYKESASKMVKREENSMRKAPKMSEIFTGGPGNDNKESCYKKNKQTEKKKKKIGLFKKKNLKNA
uniref:Acrosin n=1 Tax=Leptobrachium leishanense TaxID=445787 RepID=A0A8C5M4N4_9ANUR